MGLKDLLGALSGDSSKKKPATRSGVITMGDRHPVAEYTDMLLKDMQQRQPCNITLDGNGPLPPAPGASPAAMKSTLPEVINRLKVQCGYDPLPMKTPTDGTFEKTFRGRVMRVNLRFDDGGASPVVRIAVERGD